MKQINEFKNEYEFLSNFYITDIILDKLVFPTVEHAFVAAKTLDVNERKNIQLLDTPGKAKRFGRNLTLREDWEEVKEYFMFNFLLQKFECYENAIELIKTKDAELIEGNYWHDNEWGVCGCDDCKGQGKNKLGKMLMKIRDLLTDDDICKFDTELFISQAILSKI